MTSVGSSSTLTSDATSPSTAKTAGTTTTTSAKPGAPATTAATTRPASTTAVLDRTARPPAPGRYRYRQSGSESAAGKEQTRPAEGTLTVDPVDADGRQDTHRRQRPDGPADDTTYRYLDGLAQLTALTIRGDTGPQPLTIACTLDRPIPLTPAPGQDATAALDCGTTHGDLGIHADPHTSATVDGRQVPARAATLTITTTGQVTATITQHLVYAPGLGLITHVDTDADGTYGFARFTRHGTDDLLTATPT